MDETSEGHSTTTAYIHKVNSGINMAYIMAYIILDMLLQSSYRPGKFYLGPGNLLEFEKSAFCPGIVLEFCKIILENIN